MPEQFSLPGFEPGGPAPRPRARAPQRFRRAHALFFAIRPAPGDALALAALGRRLARMHGMSCAPLAADRLHISLHGLGGYDVVPTWLVDRAIQVADSVDHGAFDVEFDHATVFRKEGPPPYVLEGGRGLDALRQFRQGLGIAMAHAFPLMQVDRRFTPHLTMAYGGPEGLVHPIEPVRLPAHELVLIDSHQGKTIHEVLGRWAFQSATH